ncbi:MAG: ribosome assembly cofactor RimP [Bacteroidales bacterium]|nr:ribosome assembly cofactor RimP [Bacteroidales bacterium]HNW72560.1 ribosome assembly cofactor RimP [Bacteroidales bacterium]HPS51207.1 ribosome assembly cofactor RimP [Bacteroidales bacterium]
MITEQHIRDLVNGYFADTPYFLVETTVKPAQRITVYIDGDQRVTVDVCQQLNRYLEEQLDRDNQDFDLTVSSSGIDRPLRLLRQYRKNIGNELQITLKSGTVISGTLVEIVDETISLIGIPKPGNPEKKEISIKFNEIKTAVEVIKFKK